MTKKQFHKLCKAFLPCRSRLCGAEHARYMNMAFNDLKHSRKVWVQSKSPVWEEIYKRHKYEALLI